MKINSKTFRINKNKLEKTVVNFLPSLIFNNQRSRPRHFHFPQLGVNGHDFFSPFFPSTHNFPNGIALRPAKKGKTKYEKCLLLIPKTVNEMIKKKLRDPNSKWGRGVLPRFNYFSSNHKPKRETTGPEGRILHCTNSSGENFIFISHPRLASWALIRKKTFVFFFMK